uniref:Monodehydroascorbate reductase n=1 Tax=Tanacetum cinerariifolium TaxID=118510 RepID=A0A699HT70_TANCI|nr:monodehydroascorbate reductase [Tanacetum cinerariifolium]
MSDVHVNAPANQTPTMAPPTRTDDQILPHIRWVPIGKSNCYLNVERSQSNPIYKILVDILKHINFFRAFTASSTILSIYIQQFWDTIRYEETAGCYNAFSPPPTPDALINFVNDLGYSKVVRNLSNVVTNDMFQSSRTIINLCLTGKTSGFERPRAPVLQILWGVINRAHIDYAERIWEEFTQFIHTFIEDKKNLAQITHKKKKATLIVIPSISAKGTKQEVFRMPIPNKLITADIQGEPYYKEYLEKVAKHQRCLAGEKGSDPDSLALKPAKVTKKSKPSAPKADLRPPVTKLAASQQSEPKPAPANSLKSVDESIDEGILKKEPRFNDEEDERTRVWEISIASRGSGKGKKENSEVESSEDVPGIDAGVQDEGQARPNPGEEDKGQAGPNPGDAVILEEPASSTGTLSSLQHLVKDLSFGDQFFNDKPFEADNEKTTIETEAESMCIDKLEHIMAYLIQDNKHLVERLDSYGVRLYTLENLDIPQQVSKAVDEIVTNAFDWAIQAPLRNCFRDLPKVDMKEIRHQRMWETNSYKAHEDHMMLYEALEKSMNRDHTDELLKDLAEARNKKKKRRDSLKMPPRNAYILKVNSWQDWWKPLEEDIPAPPEPAWSIPSSDLSKNANKPLPLGGPPGQVIIQSDFFFNKNLEYLRYDSKGSRPTLSISKMKAAYYPDVGLDQMMPDQIWIEEECKYDIAAIAVRTHIWILSVVRIEVFSMYGYDYIKKIVLRRENLNEQIIAE